MIAHPRYCSSQRDFFAYLAQIMKFTFSNTF